MSPTQNPLGHFSSHSEGRATRCYRFQAFNTACAIHLGWHEDAAHEEAFIARAVDWIREFEAQYSRFKPDSRVSQVNRGAGTTWIETPAEFSLLLDLAQRAFEISEGRVDITALPLTELWHDRPEETTPDAAEIAARQACVGFDQIERGTGKVRLPRPGMKIDFGVLGKEYAVDAIAALARRHGFENFLISFGGDLRVSGRPPGKEAWQVGIEGPGGPSTRVAHLPLKSGGVATSGHSHRGSVRNGRRLSHLIDPRSGLPAEAVATTTILADTCVAAGILSSAACVCQSAAEAVAFLEARNCAGLLTETCGQIHGTTSWRRRFGLSGEEATHV